MLLGVWIARYLGPEQFGLLNYSTAIVALFSAIASGGLNGTVARDLIDKPEAGPFTLGAGFALQLAGILVAITLSILAINILRPEDSLAKLIVLVLSSAFLFRASDPIRYWFESRVQSRYIVSVEVGAFLLVAVLKISLVLSGAPLMTFVWAVFIESSIVGFFLVVVYLRVGGRISTWRFSFARILRLFNDSWPLILSGVTVMIYMRIDQVMLGQMLGDESVGVYTAALRISEVWYFIPTAIIVSVFPSIVAAKKHSEALYLRRMQSLYNLMVLLALAVAIPLTLLSPWIIQFLFGNSYSSAGPVLAIHIWGSVFVFLGLASSSSYLVENLQLLALARTLVGALINIVANLLLIPTLGIIGAAIGTLLSQIAAAFLFDAFYAKTRPHFWMKLKSFFLFHQLRF